MNDDPFAVLGLDETADDDAIKRRYLALVRAPGRRTKGTRALPGAAPRIRSGQQPAERLERKLLHTSSTALTRLKLHCTSPPRVRRGAAPRQAAPSQATVAAVLLDGLQQADR